MSRCNCENLACDHAASRCPNRCGTKKALYVGCLCDDCAERMPKKYLRNPYSKKTDFAKRIENSVQNLYRAKESLQHVSEDLTGTLPDISDEVDDICGEISELIEYLAGRARIS